MTLLDALAPGDPVFGVIGERQITVHGRFVERRSAYVLIELETTRGVRRRRLVHGRFVWRSWGMS